jgi:hypothetical protein
MPQDHLQRSSWLKVCRRANESAAVEAHDAVTKQKATVA